MATHQNRTETVPYVDLQAQYRSIRGEVLKALEEVCESAWFVQGPRTAKFEEEFAAYCGVSYCVSLNSWPVTGSTPVRPILISNVRFGLSHRRRRQTTA